MMVEDPSGPKCRYLLMGRAGRRRRLLWSPAKCRFANNSKQSRGMSSFMCSHCTKEQRPKRRGWGRVGNYSEMRRREGGYQLREPKLTSVQWIKEKVCHCCTESLLFCSFKGKTRFSQPWTRVSNDGGASICRSKS